MKRGLFPLYSALLFMCSFPHCNLWPLAWICLVPYLLFIDGETNRHKLIWIPFGAFLIPFGYAGFGYGYFSPLMYFAGVLCMAVLIIPVTLLLKLIIAKSRSFSPVLRNFFIMCGISSVWIAYEFFRSSAPVIKFIGCLLLGYSQGYNLSVLQCARIFGVYGISFLVVGVNGALFLLMRPIQWGEKREKLIPILFLLCVVIIALWGSVQITFEMQPKEKVMVGLIQPNTPGVRLWEWDKLGERAEKIVAKLLDMTKRIARHKPDIIILPERAFPGSFNKEERYGVSQIKRLAQEINIPILIGATYNPAIKIRFNSAFYLNNQGTVQERYDKMGLFPYGEYIPAGVFIENIINHTKIFKRLPIIVGDQQYEDHFSLAESFNIDSLHAGTRWVLFRLNNTCSFATLICTEDVLPSMARLFVNRGARFIVVMTNDEWFRRTSSLYHHLLCSVMRAVENNVSVVRAANTGISAIILPNGRIISTVQDKKGREKMVKGYIVGDIPITSGKTFYNQYGYIFPYVLTALTFISILIAAFIPPRMDHVK